MKKIFFLSFSAVLFIAVSCKKEQPQEVVEKPVVRVWKSEETRALAGVTEKRGLISKTDMVM